MQLQAGQASVLTEIGIPIWELRRTAQQQEAIASNETPLVAEMAIVELNTDWIIVMPQSDQHQKAYSLLAAMLASIGVKHSSYSIISPQQLPQLTNISSGHQMLVLMGEEATTSALGGALLAQSRGQIHTSMHEYIGVVATFSLSQLLQQPEQKFYAWQDLLLAQTYFE